MGTGGIVAITGAAALLVGAAAYIIKNRNTLFNKVKRKITANYEVETIEGELTMQDVVSYFKKLSLVQERDVPFIAKANKLGNDVLKITTTITGNSIFIGVYNLETDEITYSKLINTMSIDSKLKNLFGNEPLVVLT